MPQNDNVVDLTVAATVDGIKSRFKTILSILDDKKTIFGHNERSIIFRGAKGLAESDINKLTLAFHNELKPYKLGFTMPKIHSIVAAQLSEKDDVSFHGVVEEDGCMTVIVGNKKGKVTNFILKPQYIVSVVGGDLYYVFEAIVRGRPNSRVIQLRADDFNDIKRLQDTLSVQLMGTGAHLDMVVGRVADLHNYLIQESMFAGEKCATSLIGLERLEDDGPKYFCTPNGIYDLDGNKSEDILYMGNEHSNVEEIRNLSNLEYNKSTWPSVARTFLENIISVHERNATMNLIGWMGAIPHDYVIRKEAGTGFFPHCHIVGEPGSGKSTIMTLIKQFMGHNDSTVRVFPTPFEIGKLLNSSYNIPTILDEYGKRWDHDKLNKINTILVESFNKGRWSRGTSSLGSIYFKYKNPILFGGQIPSNDQALNGRIIPIKLYKSFHKSKNGKIAKTKLQTLQNMKDKNFWTGYNIWAARHTNEDVLDQFNDFREHSAGVISDNRTADIYAVAMLGLYYMKKLADELAVDIGYSHEDILAIPSNILNDNGGELSDVTPLTDFLEDVVFYYKAKGNRGDQLFGKGQAITLWKPAKPDAGEFGRSKKQQACVHGKELILIKIDDMVKALNNYHRKTVHNYNEIMTFVESKFRDAMENPLSSSNLVLAPKQYRTEYGMYSAFSKDVLLEDYPELLKLDSL